MRLILLTQILFLVFVALTKADKKFRYFRCPNKCSGHGFCNADNVCRCFNNYFGPDCTLRHCPYGVAWTGKAYDIDTAHESSECSNQGICDWSKGSCHCFEGFEGEACQRSKCGLSRCNGRGECLTTFQILERVTIDRSITPSYSLWDYDHTTACFCDYGYTGPNCEITLCPKGDDPNTPNNAHRTIEITTDSADATYLSGVFRFSFQDQTIEFPAAASEFNSSACVMSFQQLKNVERVECNRTMLNDRGGGTYLIKFLSFSTFPYENNFFTIDSNGYPPFSDFFCDTARAATDATCVITDMNNATLDTLPEYAFCSNRGKCDLNTGACSCMRDYGNTNCNEYIEGLTDSFRLVDDDILSITATDGFSHSLVKLTSANQGKQTDYALVCADATSTKFQINTYGDIFMRYGGLHINGVDGKGGQTIAAGGLVVDPKLNVIGGFGYSGGERADILSGKVVVLRSGSTISEGLTIASGGFYISSGGATVTGQNIIVGGVAVSAGGGSVTLGGFTVSGGMSVAAGGMIVTRRGLTLNSGGLYVGGGTVSLVGSGRATVTGGATINSGGLVGSGLFTASSLRLDSTNSGGITIASGGLSLLSGDGTVYSGGAAVRGGITVFSSGIASTGGLTVSSGGGAVLAAGIVVISGGSTISLGGLVVTGGLSSYGAGLYVSGGSTINSGSVSLNGNLFIASSGLIVNSGSMSSNVFGMSVTGGITTNFGGFLTQTGGLTVAGGGIYTNTNGGMTISTNGITCTGGMTVFINSLAVTNGLTISNNGLAVTDGLTIFSGRLVVSGGLSLSSGGLSIVGGQTISSGKVSIDSLTVVNGLVITAGGVSMASGGLSGLTMTVSSSGLRATGGATITSGLVVTSGTVTISSSGFRQSEALTITSVGLRATGGVTILSSGIFVTTGGLTTRSKGLVVGSGSATISNSGLAVTNGLTIVENGVVFTGTTVYSNGLSVKGGLTVDGGFRGSVGAMSIDQFGFLINSPTVNSIALGLVSSMGVTVFSNGLRVTTNGLTVANGGLVISSTSASNIDFMRVTGGMTVGEETFVISTGGCTVASGGIVADQVQINSNGFLANGIGTIYSGGLASASALVTIGKNSGTSGSRVVGGVTISFNGFGLSSGTVLSNGLIVESSSTVYSGGMRTTGGITILNSGFSVKGGLTVDNLFVDTTGNNFISGPNAVERGLTSVLDSGVIITNNLIADFLYVESLVTTTTPSDRRLKTNIVTLAEPLSMVSNLKGVYYNWKNERNKLSDANPDDITTAKKRHVGVIAQDVNKVLPEAIYNTSITTSQGLKEERMSVRYTDIIPVIVEALHEIERKSSQLNYLNKIKSSPLLLDEVIMNQYNISSTTLTFNATVSNSSLSSSSSCMCLKKYAPTIRELRFVVNLLVQQEAKLKQLIIGY
eukprot:gene8276-11204_t